MKSDNRSSRKGPMGFTEDPRVSLLISAVWLVFLAFPLISIWKGNHTFGAQVAGTVMVAAFGTVHMLLNYRSDALPTAWERPDPLILAYFAAMLVLAIGIWITVQFAALSLAPYFVAGSMFAFPQRWSWIFAGTSFLAALFLALWAGVFYDSLFLQIITLSVLLATGMSRYYAERIGDYQALQRQEAVVSERERVARDVHDVLGHSLTVIALKTELAERLISTDPSRARTELQEANELARAAIGEVRATVGGLRARQLGEELTSACAAFEKAGIVAEVHGTPGEVDPRHRILFAWVLREATTNVLRHAQAGQVAVHLSSDTISVFDDGVGPAGLEAAGQHGNWGHGLRGLRERVEAAGGRLTVGGAEAPLQPSETGGEPAGDAPLWASSLPERAGSGTRLEVRM